MRTHFAGVMRFDVGANVSFASRSAFGPKVVDPLRI